METMPGVLHVIEQLGVAHKQALAVIDQLETENAALRERQQSDEVTALERLVREQVAIELEREAEGYGALDDQGLSDPQALLMEAARLARRGPTPATGLPPTER